MLVLENIYCGYKNRQIIKNASFSVKKGKILSILGANGSGKSTLLKAIVGILPYQGSIKVKNFQIKNLTAKQKASFISYVPQASQIPYEFTVLEVVLMGRFHKSSFGFTYSQKDKDICLSSLEKIGILNFKDRIFKFLSGGERQLVLIARALAQKSDIIVLDEPVTGLDLGNQMRVLDILQELSSLKNTIIQTTHYPDHALKISHEVVWLDNGKVIDKGEAKDVINVQRIKDIYRVESKLLNQYGKTFLLPINYKKELK